MSAAARCGIVSPTPISALAIPAGSLPWCTSGSASYAATTSGSRDTASAGSSSTGSPGSDPAHHLGEQRSSPATPRPGRRPRARTAPSRRSRRGARRRRRRRCRRPCCGPSTTRLRAGCSAAAMPTRVWKSRGVLGDVPQVDPLAAGPAVAAVVERVGDQARFAEPLRDVVVAAGVLGVPVSRGPPPRRAAVSGVHTS